MSSRLREELKDKDYRDAFVAAYIRNGIAFQVRAMRNSRGWDQKKLAKKMGNEKLQPVISRYENPEYGRFSMSTLIEVAKAFDVGLIVRFAPFSELIVMDEEFPHNPLDVPSYMMEQPAVTDSSPKKTVENPNSGFYQSLRGEEPKPQAPVPKKQPTKSSALEGIKCAKQNQNNWNIDAGSLFSGQLEESIDGTYVNSAS